MTRDELNLGHQIVDRLKSIDNRLNELNFLLKDFANFHCDITFTQPCEGGSFKYYFYNNDFDFKTELYPCIKSIEHTLQVKRNELQKQLDEL